MTGPREIVKEAWLAGAVSARNMMTHGVARRAYPYGKV